MTWLQMACFLRVHRPFYSDRAGPKNFKNGRQLDSLIFLLHPVVLMRKVIVFGFTANN